MCKDSPPPKLLDIEEIANIAYIEQQEMSPRQECRWRAKKPNGSIQGQTTGPQSMLIEGLGKTDHKQLMNFTLNTWSKNYLDRTNPGSALPR